MNIKPNFSVIPKQIAEDKVKEGFFVTGPKSSAKTIVPWRLNKEGGKNRLILHDIGNNLVRDYTMALPSPVNQFLARLDAYMVTVDMHSCYDCCRTRDADTNIAIEIDGKYYSS